MRRSSHVIARLLLMFTRLLFMFTRLRLMIARLLFMFTRLRLMIARLLLMFTRLLLMFTRYCLCLLAYCARTLSAFVLRFTTLLVGLQGPRQPDRDHPVAGRRPVRQLRHH